MNEPKCTSTPATPTTKIPMGGRIDRYLKNSSRRLISYRSAMVLLICLSAVVAVLCYQGMSKWPVDGGLLTFAGSLALIVAALAREIRKMPDETKPKAEDEKGAE